MGLWLISDLDLSENVALCHLVEAKCVAGIPRARGRTPKTGTSLSPCGSEPARVLLPSSSLALLFSRLQLGVSVRQSEMQVRYVMFAGRWILAVALCPTVLAQNSSQLGGIVGIPQWLLFAGVPAPAGTLQASWPGRGPAGP